METFDVYLWTFFQSWMWVPLSLFGFGTPHGKLFVLIFQRRPQTSITTKQCWRCLKEKKTCTICFRPHLRCQGLVWEYYTDCSVNDAAGQTLARLRCAQWCHVVGAACQTLGCRCCVGCGNVVDAAGQTLGRWCCVSFCNVMLLMPQITHWVADVAWMQCG